MSAHTPTPWRLEPQPDLETHGGIEINGRHLGPVARCLFTKHNDKCRCGAPHKAEVAEANAEFIVRAVNHHDALITALKEIAYGRKGDPEIHEPWDVAYHRLESIALTALSKVSRP